MKKSTLVLLLVASFFYLESFSQQIVLIPERTFSREMGLNKAEDADDSNVEGSKYVKENYQQASLSTHPNTLFNVKYNAYNDDIEIEGKDNKSYAINKYGGTVVVSMLTGENYVNSKYVDDKNNLATGFFQILNNSGDLFLLKKQRVVLKEAVPAKSTYHKDQPAKYIKASDDYYIKINDGTATEIPTKKKDFANLFPDEKQSILKYIKDEKLKLKKEEDLIKIFKYIETLKKDNEEDK